MSTVLQIGKRALVVAEAGLLCFVVAACGGSKSTADNSSVTLQVTAPSDGSTVRADRVAVRGTVTPGNATVQILGKPAQVGNGVFAGSVPLHQGANTIDVVASATGAAPATQTITVNRPGRSRTRPKNAAGKRIRAKGAPPLSSATDCGGGLTAGAHTSCPFAENVRAAYESSGSGVLDVYSPTTGQTYRMYCTSGSPHVCTGGNGASVYFSSGGSAADYGLSRCAADLVVGPNTSCAFASNVQAEYYNSGPGWIRVYSPTTNQTYDMYCTAGSPHTCTGGNNAAVYFP
jgi:Glucodextranase, domain B